MVASQCRFLRPSVKKLPALPPVLVFVTAWPWTSTNLPSSRQYTPTSGGGRLGSTETGLVPATIVGGGGAGLIMTLMTESGTFAALSAFKPSTLVSKLTASVPASYA